MSGIRSEDWFKMTKDEELIWSSNPSFILHLPHLLFGLLISFIGIVAPIYLYFFTDLPNLISYLLAVLFPGGLIYTAWRMLVFKNKYFVITNKHVIIKEGIYGYNKSSKPHREIVRVDTDVSMKQKILSTLTSEDIGQVIVRTADDSGKEFVMKDVPEMSLAERHIKRLCGTDIGRDSQQVNRDITGRGAEQPPSTPHSDTTEPQPHSEETMNEHSQDTEPVSDTTDSIDEPEDEFEQYEPSDNA